MTKNPSLSFRVLAMLIALTGLLASTAKRAVRRSIQLGNSNLNETALTPRTSTPRSWEAVLLSVDGSIFAQPLYVPNVAIQAREP